MGGEQQDSGNGCRILLASCLSQVLRMITINDFSARVSPNFFDLLGNNAAMGRLFTPADETNCAECVVITHRLWEAQFDSDRNIVGKTISVDDRPGIVIGVLPESFVFTFPEVSVWMLPSWGTTTNNFADRTGAVSAHGPHVSLRRHNRSFGGLPSWIFTATAGIICFTRAAGRKTLSVFHRAVIVWRNRAGQQPAGRRQDAQLKLSWRHTLRWWGFFSLKTLLLLALCFVGSLEFTGTRLDHPYRICPSSGWAIRYLAFPCHCDGGTLMVTA